MKTAGSNWEKFSKGFVESYLRPLRDMPVKGCQVLGEV